MKIPFFKMSGAGNDFVLLDGLPGGHSGPALARRLCDRRRGIGADGLLVLSRRGKRMRLDYWNADGSAAFCGNGSRCAAIWVHAQGWTKGKNFSLGTSGGVLDVRLTAHGRAEVDMPEPKGLEHRPRLKALGRTFSVHYVHTGVPHTVYFVADVAKIDVKTLGRAFRYHKAFGKAGANVDFVEVRDSYLHLRTYERGVEDETLACGTGIVAAAYVARALGKAGDRVKVKVRGGDVLNVSFSGGTTRLEGPGEIIYQGEVNL
jgi:diaminopimelate epimerase